MKLLGTVLLQGFGVVTSLRVNVRTFSSSVLFSRFNYQILKFFKYLNVSEYFVILLSLLSNSLLRIIDNQVDVSGLNCTENFRVPEGGRIHSSTGHSFQDIVEVRLLLVCLGMRNVHCAREL